MKRAKVARVKLTRAKEKRAKLARNRRVRSRYQSSVFVTEFNPKGTTHLRTATVLA